jgi:hypothetical protein
MSKTLREMTTGELLEIERRCNVCTGHSPSWDGHDKVPPCKGAAMEEIILRARIYDKLVREGRFE